MGLQFAQLGPKAQLAVVLAAAVIAAADVALIVQNARLKQQVASGSLSLQPPLPRQPHSSAERH